MALHYDGQSMPMSSAHVNTCKTCSIPRILNISLMGDYQTHRVNSWTFPSGSVCMQNPALVSLDKVRDECGPAETHIQYRLIVFGRSQDHSTGTWYAHGMSIHVRHSTMILEYRPYNTLFRSSGHPSLLYR
jgi:hypothetical protein